MSESLSLGRDPVSLLFLFNRTLRSGSIYDPDQKKVLSSFPAQDDEYPKASIHYDSYMSVEFAAYLEYLSINHILIKDDTPEVHNLDKELVYSDDGVFDYCLKTIRIPQKTNFFLYNDKYIAFSYINGSLFSSISVEVVERD